MNYIDIVEENVNVKEGRQLIEKYIKMVYTLGSVPNKVAARTLCVPVPLMTALKKEFIKLGLVKQDKGASITDKGKEYVEEYLGFKGLNQTLYHDIKSKKVDHLTVFNDYREILNQIYDNRPAVNVSLDQAHCTCDTALKRSLLTVKHDTLLNKKILCVGDDDLISVAIGFLLKKLYHGNHQTEIHVVDIDESILRYIGKVAKIYGLPIVCHHQDLREILKEELQHQYDAVYTDPPYTIEGMNLFLSRGIEGLKKGSGLPIFFSFSHKPADYALRMFCSLNQMGLVILQMMPKFNEYHGGGIIGNIGQMMVLNTTSSSQSIMNKTHEGLLYTRDFRVKRGHSNV